MRVLLFGGTFDPPHIGHVALLKNAVAAALPDRVLVIPAGVPPHKRKSATPAALRLAMCECFRPVFGDVHISDMEVVRQGRSYTLDTVCALQKRAPEDVLYLSIGGDMLLSFTTWHGYKELLRRVVLVIQGRQEARGELGDAAQVLAGEGGRFLWAFGDTPAVSSTGIREGLVAGGDMYSLIPPPADRIVRENALYTGA